MIYDALRTSLLDLVYQFDSLKTPVILGGGYGLFLRQILLQESIETTVLDKRSWPAPRSTEDLDIFLRMSLVSDVKSMETIASVLKALGYVVIEGSEHWQFKKQLSKTAEVKIDLLSGPISEEYQDKIKRSAHRIRPKTKSVNLHTHATEEALALEDGLMQIAIEGRLSNDMVYSTHIFIPHPFTYVLMKLHAFRDRLEDERKEFGQHHALDIFRTVAMMSEIELDESTQFAKAFAQNSFLTSARDIAEKYFATSASVGIIRIRQHPLYRASGDQLDRFVKVLQRILTA